MQTRLPQNPLVEKAWESVKDIGIADVALESAQIIAQAARAPDPEVLAGHLMAFASRQEWTAERIEKEFNPRIAEIVQGVRDVYDKMNALPAASPDDAVKQSFLAVAIVDLEFAAKHYAKSGIDDILISTPEKQTPGKLTIVQDSVRNVLDGAYKAYGQRTLPLVGTTSEPALEQRFSKAFDAIKARLDEKPKAKPSSGPGFGVG